METFICPVCHSKVLEGRECWVCPAAEPEWSVCPDCGCEPKNNGCRPGCGRAVTKEARRLLANAQRVSTGESSVQGMDERAVRNLHMPDDRWQANPDGLSGRLVRGYRHWRYKR